MRKHLSRRKQSKRRAATRRVRKVRRDRKHRGGMMDYAEAVSGRQLIDSSMIPAAATGPLDAAMAEARALAAMSGGKRRAATRKDRRRRRISRKQRGGEQDYAAPSMLLPSNMYNDAGLNPEWKQY
jgi:hypothetical protein